MTTAPSRERDIAIVGVAESDQIGNVPEKSALQHHAEAAHNALADAELSKSDVNGLFTARFSTMATAEYMGIQPGFTDNTSVGGSSFVIHVAHAVAAIRAGYCDVALITHGETGRSSRAAQPGDPGLPTAQYEAPYGIIGPPVNYALACSRYMHEYGEDRTRQAMAEIAVSTPKVGQPESQSYDARHSYELRRLPQLPVDRLALPSARLLPGHRRRSGRGGHHRRESCRMPQVPPFGCWVPPKDTTTT